MRILVLLSGGLDSATVLASYVRDHECEVIAFDYQQPHSIELKYARKIAAYYSVPFFGDIIPYIQRDGVVFPGRNLILIAVAISKAQAMGFEAVAVGCNASDWPQFRDCRPEFWSAVKMAAHAYEIEVLTPLLYASKRDVVEAARKLNVPIDLTWSCYEPHGDKPCGECLACTTRNEALQAPLNEFGEYLGDMKAIAEIRNRK